jgi:hypothetical protein
MDETNKSLGTDDKLFMYSIQHLFNNKRRRRRRRKEE